MYRKKFFSYVLAIVLLLSSTALTAKGEATYTVDNLTILQAFLVSLINTSMNNAAGTQGENYTFVRDTEDTGDMLLLYDQTASQQDPDVLSLISLGSEHYWLSSSFATPQIAEDAFNRAIYTCLVLYPALPYTLLFSTQGEGGQKADSVLLLNQQAFTHEQLDEHAKEIVLLQPEETLTEEETIKSLEGKIYTYYIEILTDFIEANGLTQTINDQLLMFIDQIEGERIPILYQ